MKLFYCPCKGLFKGRLLPLRDTKRINNKDDKMVIKEIDGDYHVYIFQNNDIEIEKKVLDYYELVNFLQENKLDTYFLVQDSLRTKYLMEDVRKNEKISYGGSFYKENPTIYTTEGDHILKAEVSVNRSFVREALFNAYADVTTFDMCDLTDVIDDPVLSKTYAVPLRYNGDKLVVPTEKFNHNSLFYGLSRIYSRKGDNIYLTQEDLHLLGSESKSEEEKNIKAKLAENIYVREIESYPVSDFLLVSRFLEKYDISKMCDYLTAEDIQRVFNSAYHNEDILNNLRIKEEHKELKKELK